MEVRALPGPPLSQGVSENHRTEGSSQGYCKATQAGRGAPGPAKAERDDQDRGQTSSRSLGNHMPGSVRDQASSHATRVRQRRCRHSSACSSSALARLGASPTVRLRDGVIVAWSIALAVSWIVGGQARFDTLVSGLTGALWARRGNGATVACANRFSPGLIVKKSGFPSARRYFQPLWN